MIQETLYGDCELCSFDDFDDIEFLARQISVYLKIRPHGLDFITNLCKHLISINQNIKVLLIKESLVRCPYLTFELFNKGLFTIQEVLSHIFFRAKKYAFLYFNDYITNERIKNIVGRSSHIYKKTKNRENPLDSTFFTSNPAIKYEYFKYGCPKNSIEYCLKYDDDHELSSIITRPNYQENTRVLWTVFEWSKIPSDLSILSIAAFFSSIKCFRYLMLNGKEITLSVGEMALFGGNMDIIHYCIEKIPIHSYDVNGAFLYCHESIISFLFENNELVFEMKKPYHIKSFVFMIEKGFSVNTNLNDCLEFFILVINSSRHSSCILCKKRVL